ncbi:hypothetical protein [Syntrophomonas palmitatica]|uniref:hypothetical protein n=1 Tax=Syntrophomonas palmitatica TaxID=402877 RepID=UPI0006CF4856|nr:hypothetical protein [Syntrophomonas palmitatica]
MIGSPDGKTLAEVSIVIAPRSRPFELTVENLKLSAPEGKSAIDFGNVPGINYDIWPFNKSNADQPAPYSRTDKLLVSGVCSLTGGSGGAGVRVGDGVHLIIDKAASLSDANACLSALGGEKGPGIGGNSGFFSGSVSINGGTITATGGSNGVGLGDLTGAVTINGGEVTAISHAKHCPGIGNRGNLGGMWLNGPSSVQQLAGNRSLILPGETIVINGGSVTASADNYPGISAMSGMKYYSFSSKLTDYRQNFLGRLTINGGKVTARGSSADYIDNAAIQAAESRSTVEPSAP